jgi:glutamate carboxypeptidase
VDSAIRSFEPTLAVRVEIVGGIDRPAMESAMSADLFAIAQKSQRDLGYPELEQCAVGGASDGNLTAAAGVPTLDGMGAVGDGAHADYEWASAGALVHRAELLLDVLRALKS